MPVQKLQQRRTANGVKGVIIQIEHAARIGGAFGVDHRHVQLAWGNQDHIAIAGQIGRAFADIAHIAALHDQQFIVIMKMQADRIGFAVILRAAVGIDHVFVDIILVPVGKMPVGSGAIMREQLHDLLLRSQNGNE